MKKTLSLILAALILASSMTACGKTEPVETNPIETSSVETTAETTPAETDPVETEAPETEDPWADTETVRNDKTAFALSSLTTSIGLEIRENSLFITSLKTESGVEKVASPTAYALPAQHGNYESGGDYVDFAWVYTGYTTYNDGDGGKGYTFLFEDAVMSCTYALTVVARADMAGPFEFFANFTNNGAETILVKPEAIFTAAVSGEAAPTAWTFHKESGVAEGYRGNQHDDYYAGTGIYHTVLESGMTATAYNTINHDWNENGDIPMIYVDYGTNGIYYALEWTHGTLNAVGEGAGSVTLSAELANRDFETKLEAEGGSMTVPSVYFGVYDGDVDMGSNAFKHWFLRYKAPDNMWEDENEPLTQQDMQLGISVAQFGIQQIKWDLGWWWASDQEKNNGLVELRNPAYIGVLQSVGASTLAEFVQKAKEAGLNLTTYILLKDTGLDREGVPTSVGEYGHPEWFSNEYSIGGSSADLGDENCVAFYKEYLYNFFSETGVTTWRSDWEPISPLSWEENRHLMEGTDVSYWNTVGFGELVDHLTETLDYFRYESCSSGGSMKDFFTMTKASILNCDDSADFMSLHMTFYDASYCFHPAQLQLPCNAGTYTPGDDVHYAGIGDYLYGFRTTLTGGVMLSRWDGTAPEDITYWPYWIAEVYNKKMKPLIRYADLYHILPRPDGIHWDGLEYIDADSENEIKGLVMLWKPTNEEGPEKTIKLRGLEAETVYQLTFEDRPEQNCQKTGADLMENGLTVVIEGESGSEMIWISEVE